MSSTTRTGARRAIVANANDLERSTGGDVDPVAGVPCEYGRLERRRVGGCPVEPLKLKAFVIRSLLSPDRTARRAYLRTSSLKEKLTP
jgi:hypothetical protein